MGRLYDELAAGIHSLPEVEVAARRMCEEVFAHCHPEGSAVGGPALAEARDAVVRAIDGLLHVDSSRVDSLAVSPEASVVKLAAPERTMTVELELFEEGVLVRTSHDDRRGEVVLVDFE